MEKIVITGIGIISSIGTHVAETRQSLVSGKTGITKAQYFNSVYTDSLPLAEIPFATDALIHLSGLNPIGASRTDAIAAIACKEAVEQAKLSSKTLSSQRTAFISGSTVGGMCLTDVLYDDANTEGNNGSPFISSYSNSAHTLLLQKHFGFGGIINTFNTACSSAANAILFGARLIAQGLADRAIVGGVDTLSKFTVNGFNSLMILSKELCKPFDQNRKGLNLGEGAAFLVLEKETEAQHKEILATLSGWGNSNDAYHPSSTSPEGIGPFTAMRRALEKANLSPWDISFINAHGTATENNDETESIAMKRLFEKVPPFASTKSYTGHTLAAAGALEAVFSILNLKHQELYASLHFLNPIEGIGLIPHLQYKKEKLQHIMSNSFGFGGNCSSLIFSKYN